MKEVTPMVTSLTPDSVAAAYGLFWADVGRHLAGHLRSPDVGGEAGVKDLRAACRLPAMPAGTRRCRSTPSRAVIEPAERRG
jgi:hypothetical protein